LILTNNVICVVLLLDRIPTTVAVVGGIGSDSSTEKVEVVSNVTLSSFSIEFGKKSLDFQLTDFVRNNVYPKMKFMGEGNDKLSKAICRAAISNGGVQLPNGAIEEEFVEKFYSMVQTIFTQLRKASEANISKYLKGTCQ